MPYKTSFQSTPGISWGRTSGMVWRGRATKRRTAVIACGGATWCDLWVAWMRRRQCNDNVRSIRISMHDA
ncbi:hypothetical protein L226DRAFT_33202 [Lentinus tigrinus ALCF2SS1-7]|uniref:uncharacterized protein n=1 Tax=Lentinus tigrinus ALCF2SS1-7 TaxID=1328758 RepID=UPI001166343F|nr:hypothetical protein L226DRAFT_33202 [Lentinus tigrinus ALCF2SS1-7]